jgi:hypothetical protein
MDTCNRCLAKFHHWPDYNHHRISSPCMLRIVPLRTTHRTVKEIVVDFEERNGRHFIGGLV